MSSRSIAAARNRRVNDSQLQTSSTQQPRPGVSIASHAVISQPQNNNRGPSNNTIKQSFNINNKPLLSISDAIGLITIRLSKLETYALHNSPTAAFANELPENIKMIDISVLNNIILRIEAMEQKMTDCVSSLNMYKTIIPSLQENVKDLSTKNTNLMNSITERLDEFEATFEVIDERINTIVSKPVESPDSTRQIEESDLVIEDIDPDNESPSIQPDHLDMD